MDALFLVSVFLPVAVGVAGFGLARWLYLRARAVRSRALRFAVAGFVLLGAGGLAAALAQAAWDAGLDQGAAGRLYKAGWQAGGVWFTYFLGRFAFRYFHLSVPYRALLAGTVAVLAFTAVLEAPAWGLVAGAGGIPAPRTDALGTALLAVLAAGWVLSLGALAVSFFVSAGREAIPRRRVAKAYTGGAFTLAALAPLWAPPAQYSAYFLLPLYAHVLAAEVLVGIGLWWVFVGPSLAAPARRHGASLRAPARRRRRTRLG